MGRFVYDAASGLMVPRERRVEPIRGKRLCSLAGVGPMFFAGASAPAGPTDPDFANVLALWLADEGNGATTPIDRSPNVWTMSRTGTAAGTNAIAGPFGGTCWRSNGGDGSGLRPIHYDFSSAPGGSIDFGLFTSLTIEAWVYCDLSNPNFTMFFASPTYWFTSASSLVIVGNGIANAFVTGFSMPTAAWAHIACTWDGSTFSAYQGTTPGSTGNRIATATNGTSMGGNYSSADLFGRSGQASLTGYMGGFRYTKNVVRYSGATYTVPAAQFPTS